MLRRLFDAANKVLDERPTALGSYADYAKSDQQIKSKAPDMEECTEEV